jgi:hypothetical protein
VESGAQDFVPSYDAPRGLSQNVPVEMACEPQDALRLSCEAVLLQFSEALLLRRKPEALKD